MSRESEDLRDIALKIEQLARSHPSWSMTQVIITNMTDHITARAVLIEMREKLDEKATPTAGAATPIAGGSVGLPEMPSKS